MPDPDSYDRRLWLHRTPGPWTPWRRHRSCEAAREVVAFTYQVRHRAVGHFVAEHAVSHEDSLPESVALFEFDRRVASDGGGVSSAETSLVAGLWSTPRWSALWTPEDSLLCGGCFHHLHLPRVVAGTTMEALTCTTCDATYSWTAREGKLLPGSAPLLWEGEDGSSMEYVVRDAVVAARRTVRWHKVAYSLRLWGPGVRSRAASASLERPFKEELMRRMWHPDALEARIEANPEGSGEDYLE